jgi:hypothetical protein
MQPTIKTLGDQLILPAACPGQYPLAPSNVPLVTGGGVLAHFDKVFLNPSLEAPVLNRLIGSVAFSARSSNIRARSASSVAFDMGHLRTRGLEYSQVKRQRFRSLALAIGVECVRQKIADDQFDCGSVPYWKGCHWLRI